MAPFLILDLDNNAFTPLKFKRIDRAIGKVKPFKHMILLEKYNKILGVGPDGLMQVLEF